MTTPEDLAKAREIIGNLCHCVSASKQLRVVLCTYCVKRMQVAAALAEARKPAAEVVEALEEIAKAAKLLSDDSLETDEVEDDGTGYAEMIRERWAILRAALAAQPARGKP